MLFGKRNVSPEKLTALQFPNSETFRQAARVAVEHDLAVDAPGHHILIIQKTDRKFFKSFAVEEQKVMDPEKLPAEELSRLRRQRFHMCFCQSKRGPFDHRKGSQFGDSPEILITEKGTTLPTRDGVAEGSPPSCGTLNVVGAVGRVGNAQRFPRDGENARLLVGLRQDLSVGSRPRL
ncbi:MAG: hypothetical protein ACREOH_21475 [Candidatus Entotheonellia bacterium]